MRKIKEERVSRLWRSAEENCSLKGRSGSERYFPIKKIVHLDADIMCDSRREGSKLLGETDYLGLFQDNITCLVLTDSTDKSPC